MFCSNPVGLSRCLSDIWSQLCSEPERPHATWLPKQIAYRRYLRLFSGLMISIFALVSCGIRSPIHEHPRYASCNKDERVFQEVEAGYVRIASQGRTPLPLISSSFLEVDGTLHPVAFNGSLQEQRLPCRCGAPTWNVQAPDLVPLKHFSYPWEQYRPINI
jgi:hypothetical protein